jgi:spore coat protein A
MGPAERADVLVDFGAYAGKKIVLYSDAPAPFPMGDPRNDYFPGFNVKGNPVNGLTTPGFGPNTRVLMRFNVVAATSADVPLAITTATSLQAGIDPLIVPLGVSTPPPGVPVRALSLNETFDAYGRLIQMLGTNVPVLKGTLGQPYMNPTTETPLAGSTEVWEIYNTTADVHPMHFHLVNFQVINRQPFQVSSFGGGQNVVPNFTGPATPADPNEAGWKETVRMYPGTVTRIIMKFNLEPIRKADGTVVPTPVSPRTGGHEYVWHCHILEHEEHDMMRPMVVI